MRMERQMERKMTKQQYNKHIEAITRQTDRILKAFPSDGERILSPKSHERLAYIITRLSNLLRVESKKFRIKAHGRFDECRVYDKELSAAEVAAHYNAGAGSCGGENDKTTIR